MGYLKLIFRNDQVNVFKISSKEIPGEFSLKYSFLAGGGGNYNFPAMKWGCWNNQLKRGDFRNL